MDAKPQVPAHRPPPPVPRPQRAVPRSPVPEVDSLAKQVHALVGRPQVPGQDVQALARQVEALARQLQSLVQQTEAPAQQVQTPVKQAQAPARKLQESAQPQPQRQQAPALQAKAPAKLAPVPVQQIHMPGELTEQDPSSNQPARPRLSIWRRVGGGSLSFSIMMHVLLLVLGAFWIFRIIPVPEKKVDFMPNGGGGGSGDAPPTSVKRQQALMPKMNTSRVMAQGATAALTLPDPEDGASIPSLASLSGGSIASGGLGGGGTGGGRGEGNGKGFGGGTGFGSAGGGKGTLFGMIGATDRLSGYIYDLTQLRDGKPSPFKEKFRETNCEWQDPLVSQIFKKGLPESMLEKYYRGPEKLGVHQILIPCSKDITAPKAFGAEGKMSGGAWMIVYRGRVCAPESGDIRFCGTADNYLGVRFNNKNVLYYASGAFSEIKLSPTEAIPGLRMPIAHGDWMRVDKGRWYDMDIVIGDAGGVFSAVLYYERKGDDKKSKILFRTENIPWDDVLALDGKFYSAYLDLPKDLDRSSPVWQCKEAHSIGF